MAAEIRQRGKPMTDDRPMHERAPELLPAWFVKRMIDSVGNFAFWLSDRRLLKFVTIEAIRRDVTGALWVDVAINPTHEGAGTVSVAAAHIVAAFDVTKDEG
jgi:hypothetical protein